MLIFHDKALERDLHRIAMRTGETQADVVDRLVREFFSEHKWLTKPRRRRPDMDKKPKRPTFGASPRL
jgi:hypothetical protein